MERDGRPVRFYLVQNASGYEIVEATDLEMAQQHTLGVRWLGAALDSREKAEVILDKLTAGLD